MMTEDNVKRRRKFTVEYGNRSLTREQKKLLKQVLDKSQSSVKLVALAMALLRM